MVRRPGKRRSAVTFKIGEKVVTPTEFAQRTEAKLFTSGGVPTALGRAVGAVLPEGATVQTFVGAPGRVEIIDPRTGRPTKVFEFVTEKKRFKGRPGEPRRRVDILERPGVERVTDVTGQFPKGTFITREEIRAKERERLLQIGRLPTQKEILGKLFIAGKKITETQRRDLILKLETDLARAKTQAEKIKIRTKLVALGVSERLISLEEEIFIPEEIVKRQVEKLKPFKEEPFAKEVIPRTQQAFFEFGKGFEARPELTTGFLLPDVLFITGLGIRRIPKAPKVKVPKIEEFKFVKPKKPTRVKPTERPRIITEEDIRLKQIERQLRREFREKPPIELTPEQELFLLKEPKFKPTRPKTPPITEAQLETLFVRPKPEVIKIPKEPRPPKVTPKGFEFIERPKVQIRFEPTVTPSVVREVSQQLGIRVPRKVLNQLRKLQRDPKFRPEKAIPLTAEQEALLFKSLETKGLRIGFEPTTSARDILKVLEQSGIKVSPKFIRQLQQLKRDIIPKPPRPKAKPLEPTTELFELITPEKERIRRLLKEVEITKEPIPKKKPKLPKDVIEITLEPGAPEELFREFGLRKPKPKFKEVRAPTGQILLQIQKPKFKPKIRLRLVEKPKPLVIPKVKPLRLVQEVKPKLKKKILKGEEITIFPETPFVEIIEEPIRIPTKFLVPKFKPLLQVQIQRRVKIPKRRLKLVQEFKTKQVTKTFPLLLPKVKTITDIRTGFKTFQVQKPTQKQITREVTLQKLFQEEVTRFRQPQVFKSFTEQVTSTKTREILREKLVREKLVREKLVRVPPPKTPLLLPKRKPTKIKLKEKLLKKIQAYNVFVRAKGGAKKGKLLKANPKPLTKKSARSLGAEIVDKSLAAFWKIKKISIPVRRKDLGKIKNPGYFSQTREKYRDFKISKGKKVKLDNAYFELKGKRLDTRTEVKKIQAAKFIKKGTFITKTKPKKRRKKR